MFTTCLSYMYAWSTGNNKKFFKNCAGHKCTNCNDKTCAKFDNNPPNIFSIAITRNKNV